MEGHVYRSAESGLYVPELVDTEDVDVFPLHGNSGRDYELQVRSADDVLIVNHFFYDFAAEIAGTYELENGQRMVIREIGTPV